MQARNNVMPYISNGAIRSISTKEGAYGHSLGHSMSDPKFRDRNYAQVPEEIGERLSAQSAFKRSHYYKVDFKIREDATMFEAVQRFAAYNIGCLAVTNSEGKVIGVVSERDYVTKIALLGKSSKTTKVSEVATTEAQLIVAQKSDSLQVCMQKMLTRDIRHLPMVDEKGDVIAMLSIKDMIRELAREKKEVISKLQDFALGKGGFYEHT